MKNLKNKGKDKDTSNNTHKKLAKTKDQSKKKSSTETVDTEQYVSYIREVDSLLVSFAEINEKEKPILGNDDIKAFAREKIISSEEEELNFNYTSIMALLLKYSGISLEPFCKLAIEGDWILRFDDKNIKDNDVIDYVINSSELLKKEFPQGRMNKIIEAIFQESLGCFDIQKNLKAMKKFLIILISLSNSPYRKLRYYSTICLFVVYNYLLDEYYSAKRQANVKSKGSNDFEVRLTLISEILENLNERWLYIKLKDVSPEIRLLIADYLSKILKANNSNFKFLLTKELIDLTPIMLNDQSKQIRGKYLMLLYDKLGKCKRFPEMKEKLMLIIQKNNSTLMNNCIDSELSISKVSMKIFERLSKLRLLTRDAIAMLIPHLFHEDEIMRSLVTRICFNILFESKDVELDDEEKNEDAESRQDESINEDTEDNKQADRSENDNTIHNFLLLMEFFYKNTDNDHILVKVLFQNFYIKCKDVLSNFVFYFETLSRICSNLEAHNWNIKNLKGAPKEMYGGSNYVFEIQPEHLFEIVCVCLKNSVEILVADMEDEHKNIFANINKQHYLMLINQVSEHLPNLIRFTASLNKMPLVNLLISLVPIIPFEPKNSEIYETTGIHENVLIEFIECINVLCEHMVYDDLQICIKYHKSLFMYIYTFRKLFDKGVRESKLKALLEELVLKSLIQPIVIAFKSKILNKEFYGNNESEEIVLKMMELELIERPLTQKKSQPKKKKSVSQTQITETVNCDALLDFCKLFNILNELFIYDSNELLKLIHFNQTQTLLNFLFNFINLMLRVAKIFYKSKSQEVMSESNLEANIITLSNIESTIKLCFNLIESAVLISLNHMQIDSHLDIAKIDYFVSLRNTCIERLIEFIRFIESCINNDEKSAYNNTIFSCKIKALGTVMGLITYMCSSMISEKLVYHVTDKLVSTIRSTLINDFVMFFKSYNHDKAIVNNSVFEGEYILKIENLKYIVEAFSKMMLINYEVTSNVSLCLLYFEAFVTMNISSIIDNIISFFFERFMEREVAYADYHEDYDKSILLFYISKATMAIHSERACCSISLLCKASEEDNNGKYAYVLKPLEEKREEEKVDQIQMLVGYYIQALIKLKSKLSGQDKEKGMILFKDKHYLELIIINIIKLALTSDKSMIKDEGDDRLCFPNSRLLNFVPIFLKIKQILTKDDYKQILLMTLPFFETLESTPKVPGMILRVSQKVKGVLLKKANVYLKDNKSKDEATVKKGRKKEDPSDSANEGEEDMSESTSKIKKETKKRGKKKKESVSKISKPTKKKAERKKKQADVIPEQDEEDTEEAARKSKILKNK